MKSNLLKSIFISLILVMGVSNAWAAYNVPAGYYVYFEKPDNWSQASLLLGHNSYSIGYSMTNISNTKLYYWKTDKWDGYTEYFFMQDKWGSEGNSPTHRNAYAGSNKTSVFKTEFKKYHLFTTAGSKSSDASSYATAVNRTQTIKAQIKNGANWVDATVVPADLTASTYALTSATAAGAKSASLTKNSTTVSATVSAAYSATVSLSCSNIVTGYQFDGWYDANGNKITSYTVSDAHTVYARFTIDQHTVSYGVCSTTRWGSIQLNSETAITTTGTKTLNYGTSISFTAKPNAGYQVEGWYSNSGCTSKITAAGTSTTYDAGTLTADKTVYVKFEAIPANSHNITYTAQATGWTYGNSNPTTAEEGATVTFVVNPTAGYRVSVSSDGPALTGPNANNQYTFAMPNKDVKITVDAKPEQYTITLNKQSGTGGTSSITATYLAVMPDITVPTRTGYTFNGYFDAASGGTKYYNADGSSAKNWDKTAATPLYAQWTANQYTVKFDTNGGTGSMSNQSFEYDETKPLTANAFTRKGYEFTGWNTKDDGTGTAYTDKQSVSNLSSTNGATVTLYAQWNQLPPTTVYINPKEGWETTLKIICDGEDADMTPVGCDGYYTAEVPGGTTELKFGDDDEQTLPLTVPADTKVLYDMTSKRITKLYLKANSNWKADGARFAAYFFGNGDKWVSMTAVAGQTDLYEVAIPTDKSYPSVIFCRMNGSNNTNGWNNKWNQTADLTIPTDGTNRADLPTNVGDGVNVDWHKVWDNSCWTTYEPSNTYTVTLDRQGATTGSESVTATFGEKPATIDIPEREGYTFNGYYTAESEGTQIIDAEGKWINGTNYVDADGNWISTDCNITLYAYWIGAPYTVTLDQTGAAKEGSTTSVDANFEGNMPAITGGGALPTPQNGYAFMGYWDEKDGKGTQYYKADGTSARTWNKAEDATLYAYFKMAEITTITLDKNTFEPVDANGIGFVTATPTIEPTPTGTTTICWRLLYSNGTPVEGHNASTEGCEQNQVKFSIAGLASGNYKIEAVLRTGNNCGSGTELSTKIVNFTIASTYTITVKYTCDGKEIMAPTKMPAHVTEETEITAPDIPGYTFSKWVAGDGVTITDAQNGENTNEIIKFTAIYDGYLTAQYTTKPMVYFKNTLGWEKVYVYTFNNQVWHNGNNGTGGDSDDMGVQPKSNRKEFGEMTLVEGTDDIYFFELNPTSNYTQDNNNSNENYIAFSDQDMSTYNYFYGTNAVYRGDHKESLTLFIPHAEQQPVKRNNTEYYNKGIWMKYNSTESGYQLAGTVPNDDPEHDGWGTYGNKFTAQQPGGYTFSITKNLDANKTYEFKIKNYVYVKDWEGNAKNQWFATESQINTNACTSLPLDHEESAATRYGNIQITTNAAGEYKFTIDLSTGKVLLSVEYPIAVGDYRVIYKDNATWSQGTAHDANWYHPSRIIKENKTNETTKDIISFFISHGNNPTMKFQKVTSITNGNVTWEDAGAPKIPDNITTPGVYNFVIIQEPNGTSISMEEQAEPYTGNYYIRVDALAGKWDNYKTHSENRMIYSAFSESEANSFGEKFSHYATKYCTNGTNIKFTIANDYSPCISDTLAQDITNPLDNLDSEGTLLNNDIYSANVRFMWHHKTNKISRAYVGPAADKQSQFLMLRTKDEIQGAEGELDPDEGDIVDAEKEVYAARFADTQNWIYERTIKVKPGTRVKLYASYPKIYHIYIDNQTGWNDIALYAWKDGSTDQPLGGWPGIQPSRKVEIDGTTYHDFQVNEWVFNGKLKLNNNGNSSETNEFAIGSAGNYYLTAKNNQLSLKENGYKANVTEATAQYFRGAYDNNNATWDDNNSIVILGGSGTDWNTIRVIYDFKTNRLMAALVPDQEVSEEKIIAADVMIIRKHQGSATCITLTNDNSKLTEVKTVYGSLQFNRWVLNNRDSEKSGIEYCTKKIDNKDTYDEEVTNEHHPILDLKDRQTIYERALYFISFPFDVHLSDVFGFGTYGTHWVISEYNGLRRAQNGYFVNNCINEDCTNWDYIWDPSNFTMKANQGYLLSLDLDLMKYNNTDFWLHNIDQVELFFPSTADLKTIEKTNYQMPALTEDYECTINFNKVGPEDPTYNPVNDHRVRDSYWRCIGVPSFANYDGSLYKTEQDAENEENPINWKTNYTWQADNAAFPFLYEWNVTDNSLQVQNTSNFNFKATFAYLVQNGNSIYWSAVNAKPSNIVARSQETKRNYEWRIAISRNGEVEDQAFVRLTDHEKVTTEFDFNQDLSKEFNYGRSDIYTLIGYEKAAANSLPLSEQTTLIPLGLSIEYNGDYTIAMPDGTANIGVTLIDTESNTRTNLSAGMEYTLTLKKGDYNNRFFIEISPIQQTPTDIEYVENSHDDQARKVLIDNILYIVRDGQMFDARGARVK